MIRIRDIEFSYQEGVEHFNLGPISLDLEFGKVYGWTGANGSGKSTLAKLMAGRHRPKRGQIDGLETPGLLFEQKVSNNVFGDLTVSDHLNLCASKTRRGRIESYFPEINLLKGKYPDELSGGQLQRLAFALTLFEPHGLTIYDEVTNHLDSDAVNKVGTIIREEVLADKSRTIVVVTHDQDFLSRYCDALIKFENGRLINDA